MSGDIETEFDDDEIFRTWAVLEAIVDYINAETKNMQAIVGSAGRPAVMYSKDNRRVYACHEMRINHLLLDADQWFKTLKRSVSSELNALAQDPMGDIVHHLRNLKEHWEDNRPYFEDFAAPIPEGRNHSLRWYRANYPTLTAWSSGYSSQQGSVIGGILNLNDLSALIKQAVRIMGEEAL